MKVALPKEYFGQGLSPAIREAVLDAARRFEALGAQIVETSMPSLDSALPAYYILSSAEASLQSGPVRRHKIRLPVGKQRRH